MVVMDNLIVDCGSCQVRGPSCSDCVMTVLLGVQPPQQVDQPHEFSEDEWDAMAALADSGLVPPLRLVAASAQPAPTLPLASGEV